jgi:hypothetical protein
LLDRWRTQWKIWPVHLKRNAMKITQKNRKISDL